MGERPVSDEIHPEIGQVWADLDPRAAGRTVEVMDILDDGHALVRLNTVGRNVSRDSIGRKTKIRIDRFGKNFALSTTPPHRFGTHRVTREIGYHPQHDNLR